MPRSKKFRILGKTWTVIIKRPPSKESLNGLCDADSRTIYLHPKALQADALNIVSHETAHAVLWAVDEEHITELGNVISQVAGWVGKVQGGELTHGYGGRA
jgi:hypothetical protein